MLKMLHKEFPCKRLYIYTDSRVTRVRAKFPVSRVRNQFLQTFLYIDIHSQFTGGHMMPRENPIGLIKQSF